MKAYQRAYMISCERLETGGWVVLRSRDGGEVAGGNRLAGMGSGGVC